jgi:hypothetical protein
MAVPPKQPPQGQPEVPAEPITPPPFEYEVRTEGNSVNLVIKCEACEGPDGIGDPHCRAAIMQAMSNEYYVDLITITGKIMRQYSGSSVESLKKIFQLDKLLEQMAARPPVPFVDGIAIPECNLEDTVQVLERQAEEEKQRKVEEDTDLPLPAPPPPAPPPSAPSSPYGAIPPPRTSTPGQPPNSPFFLPQPGAPVPGPAPFRPPPTAEPGVPLEEPLEEKAKRIRANPQAFVRKLRYLNCPNCAFNPKNMYLELNDLLRVGVEHFLPSFRSKVAQLQQGRPEKECLRCLGMSTSEFELLDQQIEGLVGAVAQRGGRARAVPSPGGAAKP